MPATEMPPRKRAAKNVRYTRTPSRGERVVGLLLYGLFGMALTTALIFAYVAVWADGDTTGRWWGTTSITGVAAFLLLLAANAYDDEINGMEFINEWG